MTLWESQIKEGQRVVLTSSEESWNCYFDVADESNPMVDSKFSCAGTICGVEPGRHINVEWDNGYRNSYGPGNLTAEILKKMKVQHGDIIPYQGTYQQVLCACYNGPLSSPQHHYFNEGPANTKCDVCGTRFYYSDLLHRSEKDYFEKVFPGKVIEYEGKLFDAFCMCNTARACYPTLQYFTHGPADCSCDKCGFHFKYDPRQETLKAFQDGKLMVASKVKAGDIIEYMDRKCVVRCRCNTGAKAYSKLVAFMGGSADGKCPVCDEFFGYDPREAILIETVDVPESNEDFERFNNPMAALRDALTHDPYGKREHPALMMNHNARLMAPVAKRIKTQETIIEMLDSRYNSGFSKDAAGRDLTNRDELMKEYRNTDLAGIVEKMPEDSTINQSG